MTTVSTDVQQFRAGDIKHSYHRPLAYGTLKIGDGQGRIALFFNDPETIRAAIAHLVALENEMTAAEPVITNSARDCDEQNPDGSGEHCHRGGDHGVHQDSNGDEWRTDGAAGMQSPRPVVRVVGGREVTS